MSEQAPSAAAGIPNGRSPSGATSPGAAPSDATPDGPDPAAQEQPPTQVPGQAPGSAVQPVPSPGDVLGASLPAVAAGQGASPATGIVEGESEGSDSAVASPGAYVALAPPGHPDGEVDTRAR